MSQIYKNSSGGGGGTPIETIDGDVGSVTGSTVTIYANNASNNSGSSVEFVNSGTISTLNLTDANGNTALGNLAGNTSLSGVDNTLLGVRAGTALTNGSSNVFLGVEAGQNTLVSNGNVGVGFGALSAFVGSSDTDNVGIGTNSLTNLLSGTVNIAIGLDSGDNYASSESSNIVLGNAGVAGESNVTRIGTQGTGAGQQHECFIAGIIGNTVSNQEFVTINSSTGQLGVTASSGSITTIDGDTGFVTGSTITFQAYNGGGAGATVKFEGNGAQTMTLAFTDGNNNITIGPLAGNLTQSGSNNVGLGRGNFNALTTGNDSTAIGYLSQFQTQSGSFNTSVGYESLADIVSTNSNSAFGYQSLKSCTASNNSALGTNSLENLTSGSSNCAFGNNAGSSYTSSETSNILISNTGTAAESNVIRIGTQGTGAGQQNTCYIAGIVGNTVSNTEYVTINSSTGQLGIVAPPSSGTVTSVSVVSANGFAGTVATATTTPAITLTTTATGVLSGNGTAISGSPITQFDVLVGGASNAISSVGPGTSGQILQSGGASANPAYSTATYPSTTTANDILYSSSANTVGQISTANNGVLITSASGVPSFLADGTTGQVLTATTGSPPSWEPAASSSITITGNSGGALTGNSFTFTGGTTGLTFSGSGTTETLTGTLVVANGGTGDTSFTPYAVIAGGTTSTGVLQSIASVGTAGQILTSNGAGALPTFQANPSGVFSPNSIINLFDDFVGQTSTVATGILSWTFGGTVSTTSIAVNSSHPGITSHAAISSGSNFYLVLNPVNNATSGAWLLGGGTITMNWVFNIATLSNATNRYTLRFGFMDALPASADLTNAVYFEYSDNLNSGDWNYKTASASTRTTGNSSVAVTTGWHNAQLVINAAASSISYSIDGVSLGTITTNIPTTAITPAFLIQASAGTVAANSVQIDLFYLTQILTTSR